MIRRLFYLGDEVRSLVGQVQLFSPQRKHGINVSGFARRQISCYKSADQQQHRYCCHG